MISEEVYEKKFVNSIVENYFSNSYKELVSFFVQQKKLSAKEIIDLIEQKIDNQNRLICRYFFIPV